MYWFLYDSTGRIHEAQIVNVTQWNNLNGYAGAISFDESDKTAQEVFANHAYYTVQNEQLVKTVTDAQLLADAQQKANQAITAGFSATILGGFQVTISGTKYTLGWNPGAPTFDQQHLMQVQEGINAGVEQLPVPYADIKGAAVSIPDQTTLTAISKTAAEFEQNQVLQRRKLVREVATATTPANATAVTWTPATYTDYGA